MGSVGLALPALLEEELAGSSHVCPELPERLKLEVFLDSQRLGFG
jgi:hypothetical protein